MVLTAGTNCWAPDEAQAYVRAQVVRLEGDIATVAVERYVGEYEEDHRQCCAADLLSRKDDSSNVCYPDMDHLPELNMASVLQNLEALYGQVQASSPGTICKIYSSVGMVLIAMNPFEELPIYGPDWMTAFSDTCGDGGKLARLGPHCYGLAEKANQRLASEEHQSFVICGESGAGKTVTNKKILEYLCWTAKPREPRRNSSKSLGCAASGITGQVDVSQITEASQLLEAFGNAKTTRNDNSSRFGRFTQLLFARDPGGRSNRFEVKGCQIEHYLLERSRIVSVPTHERNFHIFHQLLACDRADEFGLADGPRAFKYIGQGANVTVRDVDDATEFKELCRGMDNAGFSLQDREDVFESIAAVLHMGNVDMEAESEGSRVAAGCTIHVSEVGRLLGVDADELFKAMAVKLVKAPGKSEPIQARLDVNHALGQRDAVAKVIYARVFQNLISDINHMLSRPTSSARDISLLDIFGFEDMLVNGFEQLFINLTNERIQSLFNNQMFDRELDAYKREGIQNAFTPPESNSPCVELFTKMKPPGIVALLNDAVLTAGEDSQKDGKHFVANLNRSFKGHKFYNVATPGDIRSVLESKVQKAQHTAGRRSSQKPDIYYDECFQVRHYAGMVTYTVRDFLPKSRDSVMPHITELLLASSKKSVCRLFSDDVSGKRKSVGAATKDTTVGMKFIHQLDTLTETLEHGSILFVRCIKANPEMQPGFLNRPLVLEQLKNGGVVSALEMRQAGLPDRIDYQSFCAEFSLLERQTTLRKNLKTRAHDLLTDFVGDEPQDRESYALGKTRVFMKSSVLMRLRSTLAFKIQHFAGRLRTRWRVRRGTERIEDIRSSWLKLQAVRELANDAEVADFVGVAKVLKTANNIIEPVWKCLANAERDHGKDVAQIGIVLDRHKGALQKNNEARSELLSQATSATTLVEQVIQRKEAATAQFMAQLQRSAQEARVLLERLKATEIECAEAAEAGGAEPEDVDMCTAACLEAREVLQNFCSIEVPKLQQRGPEGVDFESPTAQEMVSLPAQLAVEFVQRGASLVAGAEESGQKVSRLRREFREMNSQLQESREADLERLKQLQGDAQEYIATGCDGIGKFLDGCWAINARIEGIILAAQDAEALREAVVQFRNQVATTETAVADGRKWLEARRREEHEALLQKFHELQGQQKFARTGGPFLLAVNELLVELDTFKVELNKTEFAQMDTVTAQLRTLATTLVKLGVSEDEEPLRAMPTPDGDWSVHSTARLDLPESRILKKAILLDKTVVKSVTAAVEALNRHLLVCDRGFCAMFSQSAQEYMLLYKTDCEAEAFQAFNLEADERGVGR